jgi:hypothetical protein
MDDSFNFGRQARPRVRIALDPRLLIGAVVLAVAGLGVFTVMHLFSSSGKQIATVQRSEVSSADAAKDVVVESSLQSTLQTAKLAYVDGGEDFTSAGSGQLSALEPSLTYTDGPSMNPSVVSLATTTTTWSAAMLSESGTCLWIHDDATTGATTFGRGTPCTGAAASAARGTSW